MGYIYICIYGREEITTCGVLYVQERYLHVYTSAKRRASIRSRFAAFSSGTFAD